jgi:hypothetical protein
MIFAEGVLGISVTNSTRLGFIESREQIGAMLNNLLRGQFDAVRKNNYRADRFDIHLVRNSNYRSIDDTNQYVSL